MRHLAILRSLLHRQALTRAGWQEAFQDLAQRVKESLGAGEALVAFYTSEPESSHGVWSAITPRGDLLGQDDISRYGSLSVLDRVRATQAPVLATAEAPLTMTSKSIVQLGVENVLAVPLFGWDFEEGVTARRFEGCLYLHRTLHDPPFGAGDVTLVLDIVAILQHHLNLLRRLHALEQTLAHSRSELKGLREEVQQYARLGRYETRDPVFAGQVLGPLQAVSRADRVGILLLGPTGSGKSYLAQAYHYESARRGGPFVVLDCAQVTNAETLSAELFGYAPRSGYANAPLSGRPGKAQLAHKGTLFIDEIGCLPLELQHRLLRLIQTGLYSPLGSSDEVQVDVQIIAATLEALLKLVQEKRFREDLYWRLSELVVELPPLSARPADIPGLAQKFLDDARVRYGRKDIRAFTPEAIARLQAHDWSRAGNLRGLEHTVNRSLLLAPAGQVLLDVTQLRLDAIPGGAHGPEFASASATAPPHASAPVPAPTPPHAAAPGTSDVVDEALAAIQAALRQHGSATYAARALGMSRDALIWQLRRAGLTVRNVLPSTMARRRKKG